MRRIEQHIQIPPSEKITNVRGRAILLAEHVLFGPLERHGLRNMLRGTRTEYAENFGDEYLRAIEEGYFPILVGNHRAHIDGAFLGLVTKRLTSVANERLPKDKQMEAFGLIYAASLHFGYQGAMLKGFSDAAYEVLDENDTVTFFHTRPQDVQRYKMRSQPIQEFKDLVQAVRNGYGIAILAEGETKAGKTNPETGKPFGMGVLMPGAIERTMAAMYAAGRKPMIITVSIAGGSRAQNPNTRLPSVESFKAGLGFGDMHLIDMYVSSPLRGDQGEIARLYKARDSKNLNTLVGRQIAQHLPPGDRGAVYG